MATILLSAAGAALGGSVGGTVAGLSSVVVGRAVGATLGRVIDARLLGAGSDPVETGKVDRFRLTHASEGAPIPQIYGRMRIGGQVIWASQFQESKTISGGGGKGAPSQPTVTRYSYSVSLAIALCEGEVASVSRVWADGEEVLIADLNLRLYPGTQDQDPDPVIAAIEGADQVPAYRGTAYVVIEDLALEPFGNRVPQFSFEVIRAEQPDSVTYEKDLGQLVRGVALMPGTGEYTLATTAVHYDHGPGQAQPANSHAPSGQTDFLTSMRALEEELPSCDAASLVVSWFGSDLRCGHCSLRPKVEQALSDGGNMPWTVSGVSRSTAQGITQEDDRPIYGGTPADASVVEAIRHMRDQGRRVMFYPFILMDQQQGNGLPDPWSGAMDQPHLPWRGRITLSVAPGREGTPDQTAVADAEVAAFVGTVTAADFAIGDGTVTYSGPEEWSLSRFILHYAALCAAAGGVEAFCIGSEMRGLTQIRGAAGFAAVEALRQLAAEARILLGAETKISYAADWSEYFGYDSPEGDHLFHLDPLWADDNIDFIGIDNYMPLSDWREGEDHLDTQAGVTSIYDPAYLEANVEGGEGFDWYYHSPEAEAAQIRTEIKDTAHSEHWIWRYKDLVGWWHNDHHERIGGVRQALATAWEPQSKPIWFTELGCAALDKGTNQPNKFLDPKSSESQLPKFSNGLRDDLIQTQYLRAVLGHWGQVENNPISEVYGAPMLDMANAYVWAWDARPFPVFPNALDIWSDGDNHPRGHWLNGRVGQRTLDSVVGEICQRAGLEAGSYDVSQLHGVVRGYVVADVGEARAALQPLMLRFGFDAIERNGVLTFQMRNGLGAVDLDPDLLAISHAVDGSTEQIRESEAELAGRVRLRFVLSGGDHDVVGEEAVLPDQATHAVSQNDLPLALTRGEGRQVVERWLTEARVARDTIRFALPPSAMALGAGDVVRLPDSNGTKTLYRIDQLEQTELQLAEAARIEPEVYTPSEMAEDLPGLTAFAAPVPVLPLFLDLPLMHGDEIPHAPLLAVTAQPWPGTVAVYDSNSDDNYVLDQIIAAGTTIGITKSPLAAAPTGRWDQGGDLHVSLISGSLQSREADAVLNGANLLAIGDGTSGNWELLQFQEAELIGPDSYLLRRRLRGQLGSDALMPATWPVGSWIVRLDGTPAQIGLTPAQRRISRHYRIGSARRGYDDPSYVHRTEAFDGNGLRPYSPVHLEQVGALGEDVVFIWIRRTRIDGDSWDLPEVPLGEETELYRVQVLRGETLVGEYSVNTPSWSYSPGAQVADGVIAGDRVEVTQISSRYGAGLPAMVILG
ncbi:baseplate multidomain protein megatron [Parasedimentitalea huanghaiensis]|uniref:Host specificity protein n=1 Tax=Parasedimentitalea huanghaiensis TaxID=2682100 RepID=A0A6L6WA97_9RHOB|nr:glycoside hydrolase/phage tail family protein [Zongyanglinia huanghaiensis]MVO14736.1 host specificity protein [Zongyanglinia huanghaiensis]